MSKQDIRERSGWRVTLCSEGDNFFAQCISSSGITLRTEAYEKKGTAWQKGYDLIDKAVAEARARRYNAIAKPLTLMLLYVTGSDEYYDGRLSGRRACKGHDFDILDNFEAEGLIKPQTNKRSVKSVVLDDEGIKQARELLRNLTLPASDEFLDSLDEE